MNRFLISSFRLEPEGLHVVRFYADEKGVVTADLYNYKDGDLSSKASKAHKSGIELKDLYGRAMKIPYKVLLIKLIYPYMEDQNKDFSFFVRVCERRFRRAMRCN